VSATLEAVERVLTEGGDVDEILRAVVHALEEQPGVTGAAIAFVEEGRLVDGPRAGTANEAQRTRVPVLYDGATVGELQVDGEADREELERVAALVADYVLVGWDTGGERWQP
jgi:hypothetical protein